MTTAALKAIDKIGGIDNYILQLDSKSVADSNYITKMRTIIGKHSWMDGFMDVCMYLYILYIVHIKDVL